MAKIVNARTLPVQSLDYKYGKIIVPPYEVDVEFTSQEEAALNSGITADMIPAEASDTNPLADKAWVTQQGGGGDVSGKEDKVTIVSYSTAPSTISADISKYYRIDADVDTLAVTLPEVTDNTKVASVLLLITAGTTPNVTLTPTTPSGGTAPDIYYQEGYAIEAGKTYEINCLWNGVAWIVVSTEIEIV